MCIWVGKSWSFRSTLPTEGQYPGTPEMGRESAGVSRCGAHTSAPGTKDSNTACARLRVLFGAGAPNNNRTNARDSPTRRNDA